MAKYTEITYAQMNAHLLPAKGWLTWACGNEYVYGYRPKSNPLVLVKVYTSIRCDTGTTRSKDKDRIRVCAVLTKPGQFDGDGLCKSINVNRTQGWKENLKAAVIETTEKALNFAKRRKAA